ncbi:MAG: hypothetical protein Q9187_006090 [Circinaria calcarea]
MPDQYTSHDTSAMSDGLTSRSHRHESKYVKGPGSQDSHHSTYETGAMPVSTDIHLDHPFSHHYVKINQGIPPSSSTPLTDESLTRNNKRHDIADKVPVYLEEERGLFQRRVEDLKATLQSLEIVLPECTIVKMGEIYDGKTPMERFKTDLDCPFAAGAMPKRQHVDDSRVGETSGDWEEGSRVSMIAL